MPGSLKRRPNGSIVRGSRGNAVRRKDGDDTKCCVCGGSTCVGPCNRYFATDPEPDGASVYFHDLGINDAGAADTGTPIVDGNTYDLVRGETVTRPIVGQKLHEQGTLTVDFFDCSYYWEGSGTTLGGVTYDVLYITLFVVSDGGVSVRAYEAKLDGSGVVTDVTEVFTVTTSEQIPKTPITNCEDAFSLKYSATSARADVTWVYTI